MVSTTIFSGILLIFLGLLFFSIFLRLRGHGVRYLFLGTSCLLFLMLIGSLHFRIRSYQVDSGNLTVNLEFGQKIVPLAGLQKAELLQRPFSGARKDGASAGVWSFCGHFSSPSLGAFDAYATQKSQGVLLTWPDHKVLVTPADADRFIQSVKSAK